VLLLPYGSCPPFYQKAASCLTAAEFPVNNYRFLGMVIVKIIEPPHALINDRTKAVHRLFSFHFYEKEILKFSLFYQFYPPVFFINRKKGLFRDSFFALFWPRFRNKKRQVKTMGQTGVLLIFLEDIHYILLHKSQFLVLY